MSNRVVLPLIVATFLTINGCSTHRAVGSHQPAHTAPPIPSPPLAAFLHANYRVTSETRAPLEGDARQADVIVVSTGPGLEPDKPVSTGTGDVQVLAWDPAALRWTQIFDAAQKVVDASLASSPGSPQVDGPQPLLDQGHPIEKVWSVPVEFSPGQRLLAVYGIDGYTNHPSGVLGLIDFPGGGTPSLVHYDAVQGLDQPQAIGAMGAQRLRLTADLFTGADPACCPARRYTQELGASIDSTPDRPGVRVIFDNRPWLGAYVVSDSDGGSRAVVVGTARNSPASAVLHVADRLLSVAAAPEPPSGHDPRILDQIAGHQAGDAVTLVVSRAGRTLMLPVNLASLKDAADASTPPPPAAIGIQAATTPAGQLAGVVITAVQPGYPAEAAGLVAGDTILDAADVQVRNVADLSAAITGKLGQDVLLTVHRAAGMTQTISVRPISPPKDSPAASPANAV